MVRGLQPRDEGKSLVTPGGDTVGVIERIDAGKAYVCPTPGLLTGYGSWICGTLGDGRSFQLDEAAVAEIECDCVVVERGTARRSRPKRVE